MQYRRAIIVPSFASLERYHKHKWYSTQEKKLFWEGYNSCIFGVSHKNKIETLEVQQILHVTALAYLVGEF